jgi:hypothetical protein
MSCEDCHFCGVLCGLRTCVILMCLRFKQSLVRLLEILIVGEKQRERIYSRHGLAMNNPANPRASGGTVVTRLNSKRWSGEWIDTRLFDTVDKSLSWWWNVNNPWSGPDWRQRRRRKSGKICLPSHVSWWFKKLTALASYDGARYWLGDYCSLIWSDLHWNELVDVQWQWAEDCLCARCAGLNPCMHSFQCQFSIAIYS